MWMSSISKYVYKFMDKKLYASNKLYIAREAWKVDKNKVRNKHRIAWIIIDRCYQNNPLWFYVHPTLKRIAWIIEYRNI